MSRIATIMRIMITAIIAPTPPNTAPTSSVVVTDGLSVVVGVCLTISRVLVYRHECPDHERLSTGLDCRPATQSAIDKNVPVTAQCAENSHHSEWNRPDHLMCTPRGDWLNDQTHCVCDLGYSNDDEPDKCESNESECFSYHA